MFKDLIKHLACIYSRYKDDRLRISENTIYELHDHVEREFSKIQIQVLFESKNFDDFEEVKHEYKNYDKLYVSALNNNSDLFPGTLNLKFRAVHDVIHIDYNYKFDFIGEYNTYKIQSEGLSFKAKQVLFSEIVLQAAYCLHYGEFAPVQKIVLLSEEYIS